MPLVEFDTPLPKELDLEFEKQTGNKELLATARITEVPVPSTATWANFFGIVLLCNEWCGAKGLRLSLQALY